jgi:hypothetical protein
MIKYCENSDNVNLLLGGKSTSNHLNEGNSIARAKFTISVIYTAKKGG